MDNASSDGTREDLKQLRAQDPTVVVILPDSNLGVAGGRNLGWASATRPFILNLDDDTRIDLDAMSSLYRAAAAARYREDMASRSMRVSSSRLRMNGRVALAHPRLRPPATPRLLSGRMTTTVGSCARSCFRSSRVPSLEALSTTISSNPLCSRNAHRVSRFCRSSSRRLCESTTTDSSARLTCASPAANR